MEASIRRSKEDLQQDSTDTNEVAKHGYTDFDKTEGESEYKDRSLLFSSASGLHNILGAW